MTTHYHYTVHDSVAAEFSLVSFIKLNEAITYNTQKNMIRTKENKEQLQL